MLPIRGEVITKSIKSRSVHIVVHMYVFMCMWLYHIFNSVSIVRVCDYSALCVPRIHEDMHLQIFIAYSNKLICTCLLHTYMHAIGTSVWRVAVAKNLHVMNDSWNLHTYLNDFAFLEEPASRYINRPLYLHCSSLIKQTDKFTSCQFCKFQLRRLQISLQNVVPLV